MTQTRGTWPQLYDHPKKRPTPKTPTKKGRPHA